MTEQPKLIESVEEALEAEKQGRLVGSGGASSLEFSSLSERHLGAILNWIDGGLLSWKPAEYEYVTMETFSFREAMEDKYTIQVRDDWVAFNPKAHWLTPDVIQDIETNRLRRKKVEGGGEIELVEMSHVQPLGPVIYVLEGQEPFHSNYERTNRTFKGVIHEE